MLLGFTYVIIKTSWCFNCDVLKVPLSISLIYKKQKKPKQCDEYNLLEMIIYQTEKL